MFQDFLTALLHKVTQFLTVHPDFFSLKTDERSKKLDHLTIPKSFKDYLLEVKEADFMEDLVLITRYLKAPKTANLRGNAFFKAFSHFLSHELAMKIDYLDGSFYLLPTAKRNEVVDKMIAADSPLAQALKDILVNFTYQQLTDSINKLISTTVDVPYLLVQSPIEMEMEMKRETRKKLAEKNQYALAVFQINKKLIGGIRIFEDGKVQDHSWLSRVLHFTSLTTA